MSRSVVSAIVSSIPSSDGNCPTRIFAIGPTSDYVVAIEDMLEETSTKFAPWYLIPANDKPFGRIAAFCILTNRLGKGVSLKPRPISPKLFKQARRILSLSAADIRRAAKKADRRKRSKHAPGYRPTRLRQDRQM